MNVFVCIPCLMLGGSEVATLQMVQALTLDGVRVKVVIYYEFDSTMIARYRACGAELIFLNERRTGGTRMLQLLWRLTKLFRKEKPDVVHVQYFAPGMIPILAARLVGIRTVFATIHAAGDKGYGWKAKTMFRISAALTTHFFCVAENTERFWFGCVGVKHHSTLHNSVDLERFAEAVPVKISGIDFNTTPVIGIVGRVVRLKGHDCLFRAVHDLLNDFPTLKVLVIGTGSEEGEFRALTRQLGIESSVIWIGRVEPEELPGYYKAMDILVMPSHWEGFGLTAAEAMATGVPVVGCDVPGLREVIGNAGLLVPIDDDRKLAFAIKQLQDPSLRLHYSQLCQARVRQYFNSNRQMRLWQDVYRHLLSNN